MRWQAGSPRVLVTDCWLTNAGDAAIALATQRMIQDHAPGAAVLHAAYGAELVGERYPELELVPPLESLVGTRWSGDGAGAALVAGAHLVVSQGGGFLREEYQPWSRLDALQRAAATGVQLVLLGQTIGRFDRAFARRTLREVLRSAAAIVVRDPASVHHVLDLGADPATVTLGADPALALTIGRPAVIPSADAPIAVVLSDYAVERGRPSRRDLAFALLAAVTAALPGRAVEVWSSAQSVGDEHDERIGAEAVERLPTADRSHVEVSTAHVGAHELLARTARAGAVVSMRFHPALLAAGQGTPTLLVLDDQKAGAFDGTPLAAIVERGDDPARFGHRLAGLPERPPPPLGDLASRLDRTVSVLASALAAASASARATT